MIDSCYGLNVGVYHIEDLKIDLGIAQVVPMDVVERMAMFPPLENIHGGRALRLPGNNYSLLISPHERSGHPLEVEDSQRKKTFSWWHS